jgi:ABC transport system ATP-binding/permease protein
MINSNENEATDRGMSYLVGIEGVVAGSRFLLSSNSLTIGRDDDNDIAVSDQTISRRHASLQREENGGYALVDEQSANGVFVNGLRVERIFLQAGDRIQIGDSLFRYEPGK